MDDWLDNQYPTHRSVESSSNLSSSDLSLVSLDERRGRGQYGSDGTGRSSDGRASMQLHKLVYSGNFRAISPDRSVDKMTGLPRPSDKMTGLPRPSPPVFQSIDAHKVHLSLLPIDR